MIEVTKDILKQIYNKRDRESKKYDFGIILIIGGSEFYTGAPALSGLAAFRAGVDMVRIIAPKRAADIMAGFSPDLSAYALEENHLTEKSLSLLLTMTESIKVTSRGAEAVVIGGGIGRSELTQNAILKYLEQVTVPIVIDADAIYAIAKKPLVLKEKPFLITPNLYEFFILTGQRVEDFSIEQRAEIVYEKAKELQTTILLKGSTDIISNGKEIAVSKIGSPYLTVGGAGDVLAGICGALIAKGVPIFTAAQAGAYINSAVGQLLEKELGESLTATDLINNIFRIVNER
ncbi:MAG: NAD(P)H-hydrate dehydratase [Candidatus Pacebacteria bacterium]|nr:NAD(P)H-hydrate dehydratase [Candidatus Paceibacterota bacterium]